jgi:hypothetical protein
MQNRALDSLILLHDNDGTKDEEMSILAGKKTLPSQEFKKRGFKYFFMN